MFSDIICFKENTELFEKLAIKPIVLNNDLALINSSHREEIRKGINGTKRLKKIILVQADKRVNRFVIENFKDLIIFNLEDSKEKDYMAYRNGGLNHVLCKLAKQNNIAIAFNFNLILNSNNKALVLGRMIQNVKLCRKYKVKTLISSFANNAYELRSYDALLNFGICLGMHPKEAKESLKV